MGAEPAESLGSPQARIPRWGRGGAKGGERTREGAVTVKEIKA